MVRYRTAGESHGRALMVIIEGVPAGLNIERKDINEELARRQLGYGRGGRMQIERDEVEIISGVRHRRTLGSPIGLLIRNRDWVNWEQAMSPDDGTAEPVVRPRPGHADLAGHHKYGHRDLRNVLERASARDTAARVAAGAVSMILLRELGVHLIGCVCSVGSVASGGFPSQWFERPASEVYEYWRELERDRPLRCPDAGAEQEMVELIDACRDEGDTLGGVVEVCAMGVPPGLGSYAQWSDRLDGRLARALMSIPGIKSVEVGDGFSAAQSRGSRVHDPIVPGEAGGTRRTSNNAGGLEGGVTNGREVRVRAGMKPIATLRRALPSVDLSTGEATSAHHERSDVCAVPSAGVVAEAVTAVELAGAIIHRFGGDRLDHLRDRVEREGRSP